MAQHRKIRILISALSATLALLPLPAAAYPWMIRHGQPGCGACHADPSGGGILTQYGRAQSGLLLPPRAPDSSEEPIVERSGFFFGLAKLPEWLNLGFSVRLGGIYNRSEGLNSLRPVQMVTDFRAAVDYGPLQAVGTIGYAIRGALLAAITAAPSDNLVSREHWIGLASEDESVRVRAGRITLPFGLRIPEHNAWVRLATRTDLNEHQQHGVAFSYNNDQIRTEVMAILGNLQLHPAEYRERGGVGFFEWAPSPRLAFGVSSLVTYAHYDFETRESSYVRQAHGVFGRWSPIVPLVLMAEADVLLAAALGQPQSVGATGIVQLDWEIIQGVHLMATAESLRQTTRNHWGGWLSANYFILPQLELRVDAVARSLAGANGRQTLFTLLGQVHLSL